MAQPHPSKIIHFFFSHNSLSRNISYTWFNVSNNQGFGMRIMKYKVTSKFCCFQLAPRQQNHLCKKTNKKTRQNRSRPKGFGQCFQNKNCWGCWAGRTLKAHSRTQVLTVIVSQLPSHFPRIWVSPIHSSKISVWEGKLTLKLEPKTSYSECLCLLSTSMPLISVQVVNFKLTNIHFAPECATQTKQERW